ncbi:unnamed protein product [Pedinophyceae sp. YPF-701]|nr:unnamed protein product [Pedinophyceae sp. YPF-701]
MSTGGRDVEPRAEADANGAQPDSPVGARAEHQRGSGSQSSGVVTTDVPAAAGAGEVCVDLEREDTLPTAPEKTILCDGETYIKERDEKNPFKHRTDLYGKAMNLVWNDWYIPKRDIPRESLAGLAVGLSVLPEVVAFALVAGVPPAMAIHTSVILAAVGVVTGGRPGLVQAASGSIAVISKDVVADHGVPTLFYAVLVFGFIQLAISAFGGGKLITLVPHPVMIGFVNGLTVIIALAQVRAFKATQDIPDDICFVPGETDAGTSRRGLLQLGGFQVFDDGRTWVEPSEAGWMLFIVAVVVVTMIIHKYLCGNKKFGRYLNVFPASLAAIVVAIVVEFAIVRPAGGRTKSIGDIAKVTGDLYKTTWQECDMPQFFDELPNIIVPALTMTAVGLMETLMTQQIMDEYTSMRTNSNREVFSQGASNVVAGMFAGMGGCGMIAQCMVNLQSGGYRRLSTFVAFLLLLLVDTVAYEFINVVPLASLAGVMWVVTTQSFFWHSFKLIWLSIHPRKWRERYYAAGHQKINRVDVLAIVVVTLMVIFTNMALGVGVGIVLCALGFAWKSGQNLRLLKREEFTDGKGRVVRAVYEFSGPLFFASAKRFQDYFDRRTDPPMIEIHCREMSLMDFSALDAINHLAGAYRELGKEVHLRYVREECMGMYKKAEDMMAHVASVETYTVRRTIEDHDAPIEEDYMEHYKDRIVA